MPVLRDRRLMVRYTIGLCDGSTDRLWREGLQRHKYRPAPNDGDGSSMQPTWRMTNFRASASEPFIPQATSSQHATHKTFELRRQYLTSEPQRQDVHATAAARKVRHRPPPPPPSLPTYKHRLLEQSASQPSLIATPQLPDARLAASSALHQTSQSFSQHSQLSVTALQAAFGSAPFAARAVPSPRTRRAIRSTARKLAKAFAVEAPPAKDGRATSSATLACSTPTRAISPIGLQLSEVLSNTTLVEWLQAQARETAEDAGASSENAAAPIAAPAAARTTMGLSAWGASESAASVSSSESADHELTRSPPLDLAIPLAVRASASAATMLAVHAARGDSQNPNIRPSLLEQWDDLRTKGVKFDEVVHRADAASGDSPIRTLPPFRLITRATERLAEIRKAEEEIKAAEVEASRDAARRVSRAAAGPMRELAQVQQSVEAAAVAAIEARSAQKRLLAAQEAEQLRMRAHDNRIHADQEGWRQSGGDVEATRGSTYREWVAKLTSRADVRVDVAEPDVVRGMWACCESLDPDAPGCVHANHSDAHLRCLQCGLWILKQHWTNEKCYFHPEEPVHERWGAMRWTCCGKEGLHKTRYQKGKNGPSLDINMNWGKADIAKNWVSTIKHRRSTMDETLERNGCQLGHHVHSFWPKCSHCDEFLPSLEATEVPLCAAMSDKRCHAADPNETPFERRHSVPDPVCALCGTENRVCTQCETVAGPLSRAAKGEPTDTKCQFHTGVWTTAWRTRQAVKQLPHKPEPPRPAETTKTPPPTRVSSPLLFPPSSPPPTSIPPSPRRWASTECQTVQLPVQSAATTQTFFIASQETQTGDQNVNSSAQTDALQAPWLPFHTNHKSHSLVVSRWDQLPVDYFKHGDRFELGLVKQPEHLEWSGPTPLRDSMNAARKKGQRLQEFTRRIGIHHSVRCIRDAVRSWQEHAQEMRHLIGQMIAGAHHLSTTVRWHADLRPSSSTALKSFCGVKAVRQVRAMRFLLHWAMAVADWKRRMRDEATWVGNRLRYGLLHEAFLIWQCHWADLHQASQRLSRRMSPTSIDSQKVENELSGLIAQKRWRFLSQSRSLEGSELDGSVVTATLADLVDPEDGQAQASKMTTSFMQTVRAWEWAAREKQQNYKLPGSEPTEDKAIQTLPAGQKLELTGPERCLSVSTQTPGVDPAKLNSKVCQTEYLDVFGSLDSVYTKRKGHASANLVVEFANAGDEVSRKAVAAAHKRIAARLLANEQAARKAVSEHDEDEVSLTGSTWTYPARVPPGYREDVSKPSAHARPLSREPTAPTHDVMHSPRPNPSTRLSLQTLPSWFDGVSIGSSTGSGFFSPDFSRSSPTTSMVDGPASAVSEAEDKQNDDGFAFSELTASLSAIAAVAASISQNFDPKLPTPNEQREASAKRHSASQQALGPQLRGSSVSKLRASASLGRMMSKR